VGELAAFRRDLLEGKQPTLAGFDFPIGLPAAYGAKTGFAGFTTALDAFGTGLWSRFYEVGERAEDISLHRPFYPRLSASGMKQAHLFGGHAVPDMDALRRACERRTADRPAACALFWTLGGNQVGKAAITGWRELVQPARREGARLWPFDGALPALAEAGGLVLCETYPAEAYRHLAVRFEPGRSKRRRDDRRAATTGLADRCHAHAIRLSPGMADALADGFGAGASGEDRFDAAMGLLGMIEVAEARRAAAPATTAAPHWEGWILGQSG
jgi:hypothetical protein